MNPEFIDHPVRPGFVVADSVHNRRVPFVADASVNRTPADTDAFRFPVTSAVEVDASTLSLPYRTGGFVRAAGGEMLAEMDHRIDRGFQPGDYLVEVDAPIKLYLLVNGAFEVETADERTRFRFDDATTVRVGARSYHEQPTGTTTVTDDPRDVLDAVSLLSSSLKELSPERSFPTLRGHPPLVAFGDEFSVPDGVERPETGVTIELPPDPEYLLPVAPLSYYLGAELQPADSARLVTDAGFEYDLEPDRGFQREVERTLKQVFTLDCVTRTEGLYPIDLHERRLLADRTDLDFAALYDQSIPAQLRAYLGVDYETVADAVPNWCLAVDCRPDIRNADHLPLVVNDLGVVRTQTSASVDARPERARQIDEFTRTETFTRSASVTDPGVRGPAEDATRSVVDDASFVELPDADAINHAWIGEEWPHNADKLLKAGFENGLTRYDETDADGSITVTLVCNDDRMRDEYADEQLYGNRDELEFSVETHANITVAQLRELLERDSDFFHYIGHVEGYEFVCQDGGLDVRELERAGPKLFLLNGCTSFEQGRQLVEAGSVAGVVTRNDVGNESAVEVGKQIANLLNNGFSIGAGLHVIQEHWLPGSQYLAIGKIDAGFVPSTSLFPTVNEIDRANDGSYSLTVTSYPIVDRCIGGFFQPFLDSVDSSYLCPTQTCRIDSLRKREVADFIDGSNKPVIYNGELRLPFDVTL